MPAVAATGRPFAVPVGAVAVPLVVVEAAPAAVAALPLRDCENVPHDALGFTPAAILLVLNEAGAATAVDVEGAGLPPVRMGKAEGT